MTTAAFDVLGIGNAIVDVIARADDRFLSKHDLTKGSMMLIDEARADALYAAMGSGIEVSGGSCGNTMAGVASFGGKGAYIGKVRNAGGIFLGERSFEVLGDLGAEVLGGMAIRRNDLADGATEFVSRIMDLVAV